MKKVRYQLAIAVTAALFICRAVSAAPLLHLNLRVSVASGTCDVQVTNRHPATWLVLDRAAFPLAGGQYRGAGFSPVRVAFRFCAPGLTEPGGSIRLHASSMGQQPDAGLKLRDLWGAGDTGVGFDVLVRRPGARRGAAHRLTPGNNMLPLDVQTSGHKPPPDVDVESRLRSYVKRERISSDGVKTILLLSVVYG